MANEIVKKPIFTVPLQETRYQKVHIVSDDGDFKLQVWEKRGGKGAVVDALTETEVQSTLFRNGEPFWVNSPDGRQRKALSSEVMGSELFQTALEIIPASAKRHIISEK